MDLKETYNKIAHDWSASRFGGWGEESVKKYISLVKKDGRILDLGCGSGLRSKTLADAGFDVLGIDFSEKIIKIAREKVPNANFQIMDVSDIGKLKGNFDGIFARAILLHFHKKYFGGILEKIKNKMNDGGYLYLALKEKKQDEKEEENVKEKFGKLEVERFFSYYNLGEVKHYLSDLNMKVVYEKMYKPGDRNWIIVIAQK